MAIVKSNPALIGISLPFSVLHDAVLALAAATKACLPRVTIVIGGAHASAVPYLVAASPYVDYVVKGEGDMALPLLANALEHGVAPHDVAGIYWKDNGVVLGNDPAWVRDLDSLPFPAYDLLDMQAYSRANCMHGEPASASPAMPVITSRGCPWRCLFCSIHPIWGGRFRSHSHTYTTALIDHLVTTYGIRHLLLEDDNFSYDLPRAKSILRHLATRNPRITWSTPNGLSIASLDEEFLMLSKASGCTRLTMAIESGDQTTLRDIVQKPLALQTAVAMFAACRRLRIPTTAFFVIGLPGESISAIHKSLAFAVALHTDSLNIMFATPYPGTALHDHCANLGLLLPDFSWSRLTTQDYQIAHPQYTARTLKRLARRAILRHAIRNPTRVLSRVMEKSRSSPHAVFSFAWTRIILRP